METTLTKPGLRQDSTPKSDTKLLCGCGLSHTFPLCDGSQVISKTREAGKLVRCGAQARSVDARKVDGEDASSTGHAADRKGPA